MKNQFLRFIATFAIANVALFSAKAQNAREVSTSFNKETKPAYQADYPVGNELMETTLIERFKKAGFPKGKSSKGFVKYEGIVFPELSTNKIDVYTKVEGKKENATVLMLVSTGYDNFVSTATDAALAGNSISFLNKLKDDAAAMKAKMDYEAQLLVVKKAEANLVKAEKNKSKLEKKKASLEADIEKEKKATDKVNQLLESEKLKLENLKGQNDAMMRN